MRLTSIDEQTISVEADLAVYDVIKSLADAHRLEWVKMLCGSIQKPGTIAKLREVVNASGYDDLPPA